MESQYVWSSKKELFKKLTPFELSIFPGIKIGLLMEGSLLKKPHFLSFLRFDNPLKRFKNLFEPYKAKEITQQGIFPLTK